MCTPMDQQQMQSGTDSRSAPDALYNQSEPHLSRTLHSILEERRVVLQWIPAHCGINGNEMGDKLAKKGAAMKQHDNPITLAKRKTIIKHCFKTRKIPDNYHKLDRAGQVIIMRLRTGHNKLNAHMHKTMKFVQSPLCTCQTENQTADCTRGPRYGLMAYHYSSSCMEQRKI